MTTRYEAVVDVYYRLTNSYGSMVFGTRWLWWAKVIRWSYLYGTAFMPLAHASVIDAWIRGAGWRTR